MTNEKPLFIPLRTEWFRQFESGAKDTEYRAYSSRWNERTCRAGRAVTISHGYSGARIAKHIAEFTIIKRHEAPNAAQQIYPDADYIAAIRLE
jgi:hypothetical protein